MNFTFYIFLKLIRFPNLLIVVFTQYLIQYGILVPLFSKANLSPALPPLQFALFVCSTVIIAATGYIINDILDADIDKINKPKRLIVTKYLTKKKAWQLYFTWTTLGFFISLYLAFFVKNLLLILIYPVAILLLAAYSFYLKKMPFWGNLVVSIFCAFVPGVVLFAERLTFLKVQTIDYQIFTEICQIVCGYAIFAFISTLFREIIKDLEDIEGDLQYGCRTLPITLGVPKTKMIAGIIGVVFLFLLFKMTHIFWTDGAMLKTGFSLFLLILPLLILLLLLLKTKQTITFHRISTGAKILMLNGLILLIILSLILNSSMPLS